MPDSSAASSSSETLVDLARQLYVELHPDHTLPHFSLDSTLEKDLGLDSLGRVELIGRVERTFGLGLPEQTFSEAETLRDLWNEIRQVEAGPAVRTPQAEPPAPLLETEEDIAPAEQATTLVEMLEWHGNRWPDRLHVRFYADEGEGACLSFGQLLKGARQVAAGLQHHDLSQGASVAIMLPSDPDYLVTFFGILLAGGVPVPLYPPARKTQLEDHLRRHRGILRNCGASLLITLPEIKPVAYLLRAQVDTLSAILTPSELKQTHSVLMPPLRSTDTAFLQYTSGSTGDPKGVILSHANLLVNIRAMGERVRATSKDTFVSWLPLYHDMGLIGAWLGSLHYGAPLILMSPLQFIRRPQQWLQAIHRYRGTLSAAPDFGYALCLRALKDREITGLDLSSWRAAFNGAEAINPETLSRFVDHFSRYGFRPEAMMPVYGLAENSVGLAFPPLERGPRVDRIERDAFTRHGRAVPTAETDATALRFVACGFPLENHDIRIVDAAGHELEERRQGRLQFRGPSSTQGYYRNPEATRDLFHGQWLNSGDLAYMADGEIFITGRVKDLIIRAGRNIYPVELEESVGMLDGIRTGNVAAFGTPARDGKPEQLVVVAETREKDLEKRRALEEQIQQCALDLTSIPADVVLLAEPGTVLKTSSGKIRRSACREDFLRGRLGTHRHSARWQILRLTLQTLGPALRQRWHALLAFAFAGYGWGLFYLLGGVTILAVVLLPTRPMRWRVARWAAGILRWATRTPLRVEGLQHLPRQGPCVVVSNHMSYLDVFVLIRALPRNLSFVAKGELRRKKALSWLLPRLGTEFVERFDRRQSVDDAARLGQAAREGRSLLFFAEGTFSRIPGLRPFRMGAFTTAAEAEIPVVPVALRGTRSMLRAGSWFPRRGRLQVTIGPPIAPEDLPTDCREDPWKMALALRDRARKHIQRYCGEPDLGASQDG